MKIVDFKTTITKIQGTKRSRDIGTALSAFNLFLLSENPVMGDAMEGIFYFCINFLFKCVTLLAAKFWNTNF